MIKIKDLKNKNYTRLYIYSITNPSGCKYIGATTNLKRRIKTYSSKESNYINQTNLRESINKYGFKSHIIETVMIYTFEDKELTHTTANILEQKHIQITLENIGLDKMLNSIIKGITKKEMYSKRDI